MSAAGQVALVELSEQKSPIWDSVLRCGVRAWRMRTGISFTVSTDERQRLRAIVAAPKSQQKHVWRALIVLLSDAGLGHLCDHGQDREVQDLRVALAGAVHA